jgi:hypothetical protein
MHGLGRWLGKGTLLRHIGVLAILIAIAFPVAYIPQVKAVVVMTAVPAIFLLYIGLCLVCRGME